ncbi:MAG: phytanoyl-CoA dioxygenase family protein [Phenylobacterium sp.]
MTQTARKTSDSLAEDYRRDGFVVVRGLFSPPTLQATAAEMVATFRARAQALGLDLPDGIDQRAFSELAAGLFQKDIPAYMAAAKLTQYLVSVHRMGVSPELMGVIDALGLNLPAVSTRPVIHYMADRLKIPGGYQKSPPHQDWRSVQGSLDGLTVWTPLYDVGPADYPLEVIRGSHLGGLLESQPDMPQYRVLASLYDETAFEVVPLKAGDAVIFSGFLVHRTGERGGEAMRVAFSFRFNNVAEPTFAERGFPDPYAYRPDPAIVTPGFASAADVSRVFGEPVR